MHAIKIEKVHAYLPIRSIEFLGNCNDRHTFLDSAKFGSNFSFVSSNFLSTQALKKPVKLFESLKNGLLLDFLKPECKHYFWSLLVLDRITALHFWRYLVTFGFFN